MNQGTYPLAASMVNQINRIDVVSNNLANINTHGFKQEDTTEGSFNYYLQRAQNEGFTPTKINTVTNTIPKMDSKYINSEMGPIMPTGNALDFALNSSDTFFRVQDSSGEVVYTRDGAFKNLNGFLVDSNGQFVLGNDNGPIEVADDFQNQISIAKISYTDIEKYKDNNYKEKDGAAVQVLENIEGELIQGAIEKSNVNSVSSMVQLIEAHRSFEQSQKAVSSIDQMNGKLIDKLGNNNS
ncbi:flagellar biosynthesis protein FlgG [Halarcobacter ebronensis]|uniref:Flagellar biosynthesis protein FlgG n=1 Tax=Halarcobacter ebronensis TaxID=1462615 RepID=A0A4Q0YK67_9BACT|nr:flagellar hook-basal body protein [Halarcobacter ebronensis]QKF82912.1 flagellar distal rod protein FlgG [Halarcobacter ebronensis]RXJ69579.1 flagellar biosynthesis protein FlgG [Halarcobacter ebronensis]RXK06928.1 flagellar biosynthesis protein FlgG [Halarcobacter ebronensis]